MSDCSSSYQDVSCYGTLPRESPRKNKDGSGETLKYMCNDSACGF